LNIHYHKYISRVRTSLYKSVIFIVGFNRSK
jgi:hypothetical protein